VIEMNNKTIEGKVESIYELHRFDGLSGSEKDVKDFFARKNELQIDYSLRWIASQDEIRQYIDERKL
jgi:hypothetical protein